MRRRAPRRGPGLRRAIAAAVIGAVSLGAACTADGSTTTTAAPSSTPPASPGSTPPVNPGATPDPRIPRIEPGGAPTLAGVIEALCVAPDVPGGRVDPAPLPAEVAAVVAQVEQVRSLRFKRPVVANAISDEVMDRKLAESFDVYFPEEPLARRSAAWRTIGVLPPRGDLREALASFLTGQVVGFYDPATGELVYLGEGDLGLTERLVLAHELTHALEDQRFDLTRLDDLAAACRDEAFQAALGVVEGSAQFHAIEVLVEFPPTDLGGLDPGTQGSLAGVPPFVISLQRWPYEVGLEFVTQLVLDEGTEALDAALERPPTSTEQLIHPELFGVDEPSRVEIADLSTALGSSWGDLDAMEVGEAWLGAMLELQLDDDVAAIAAQGWDGGAYRAWSDGARVAVVMQTVWDSDADAQQFVVRLTEWVAQAGSPPVDIAFADDGVRVVFASDAATLERATAGLAAV